MKTRIGIVAFIALLAVAAATGTASARVQSVDHGGTYFGDVVVEPGQVVEGDLTVIDGDATIEGAVHGNVNVVGGTAIERPGASISGQVNTVGGDVARTLVPWASHGSAAGAFAQDKRILWNVAWGAVVILVFLIFPLRTRMTLGRLEMHPGLSTAAGLVGWVAVIPVAILLIFSVVLIPLVPLEFVGIVAGAFIGKAALSLLVGRRFYELVRPHATPAPLTALVLGLILLTAAELVPVVGFLVTILVGLVGLGAFLLTLVTEQHFTGSPSQRPPLSGPPMPIG